MNRKNLNKVRRELAQLRRFPQKAATLERLAGRLGRKLVKRGKEPMWENTEFGELFVLSIPHHGGRDLSPGVQRSILDQLEDDVLAWEERLGDNEDDEEAQNEFGNGEDNGIG
jgi:hypothetical protein